MKPTEHAPYNKRFTKRKPTRIIFWYWPGEFASAMDLGVCHHPAIPFFRPIANPRSSKATARPRAAWCHRTRHPVSIPECPEGRDTSASGSASIHEADGHHLRVKKGQDHQQILRVWSLAGMSNGPSSLEKVGSVRSRSSMSCDPSALFPFPEIASG